MANIIEGENIGEEQIEAERAIEKPPVLYHGSSNTDIEVLEPQRRSYRHPHEGSRVFATPDLALATIFMSQSGKHSGYFEDVPYVVIVEDRETFIEKDGGGVIYVLPAEDFSCKPDKGLGVYEWTCEINVTPKEKIQYPSVLDAMIEKGIQVYFVGQGTEEKIANSNDYGLTVLQQLESENQKRGINFRSLRKPV